MLGVMLTLDVDISQRIFLEEEWETVEISVSKLKLMGGKECAIAEGNVRKGGYGRRTGEIEASCFIGLIGSVGLTHCACVWQGEKCRGVGDNEGLDEERGEGEFGLIVQKELIPLIGHSLNCLLHSIPFELRYILPRLAHSVPRA
ncbi:hypothetical protein Tco_0432946 [Tanacetum coccineum]